MNRYNTEAPLLAFLFAAIMISAAAMGCSRSEDQIEFERNAFRTPENFTRVSSGGVVDTSHVDDSDWQIGPMFRMFIEVEIPAFPNPTEDQRVEIELFATGSGTIEGIYAMAYPDMHDLSYRRLLDAEERTIRAAERVVLSFEPADFAYNGVYRVAQQTNNGLHRVFIFDRNNNLITYGDVQLL
ncbi:hypothetical protein QA596_09925 [Balneolales bacterium ANBcel1]|nr:hypothetical protein [Balneolales bacterium ANBcel1]